MPSSFLLAPQTISTAGRLSLYNIIALDEFLSDLFFKEMQLLVSLSANILSLGLRQHREGSSTVQTLSNRGVFGPWSLHNGGGGMETSVSQCRPPIRGLGTCVPAEAA